MNRGRINIFQQSFTSNYGKMSIAQACSVRILENWSRSSFSMCLDCAAKRTRPILLLGKRTSHWFSNRQNGLHWCRKVIGFGFLRYMIGL